MGKMTDIEIKEMLQSYKGFKQKHSLAAKLIANLGRRYRLADRLHKKLPDTIPSLVKISHEGARIEAWNAYQASKAIYNTAWQEYFTLNQPNEKANQELTENRKEGG